MKRKFDSLGGSNAAPKWILPPELKQHFDKFITLYDTVFKNPTVARRPLIIYGAPGIGKSMFTHAFETLYRRDHQIKEGEVKRVNVAALAKDLIESELFGHEKGAFTGAIGEKKGFVEIVKLLILEEIGELEQYIQAKLLTFIEDGLYYRVGSTEPRYGTDSQIIATTNVDINSGTFRQDLLDRCYTFYVPALHERRGDVLYILACQYPDFFRTLVPWQILAVMAYHWPGNMREIEKFGMTRTTQFCHKDFFSPDLFTKVNARMSDMEDTVNLKPLDKAFLKNNISTKQVFYSKQSDPYTKPAFQKTKLPDIRPLDDYENIGAIKTIDDFDNTTKAMRSFAQLFCVKFDAGISLMDPLTITGKSPEHYSPPTFMTPTYPEILDVPGLSAMFYQSADYAKSFDPEQSEKPLQGGPDFFAMTENDVLKSYYQELLSRTNGNVAEVARRSGVNRKTLDNKLERLGIKAEKPHQK